MHPLLTLLATEARDILVDESGTILKIQEGGPALFLRSAFDAQGTAYDFRSPEKMEVEILITPEGEKGRVKKRPMTMTMTGWIITTPALVVSTILDEISLESFSSYNGKLFLDVQGSVRDGSEFGKKKFWNPSQAIQNSIFCLKATEEELLYVPADIVEAQKKKMLLMTKGSNGAELTVDGKQYSVVPSKALEPSHTIGAGDTFFGFFVGEFLKTGDPQKSLQKAQEEVEQFLQNIP